ncbi:MAG: rod shape-determining protein [Flavobacteriales bacterium]|nr:rod shape-determining protein [Flavobacteriales bacterium]
MIGLFKPVVYYIQFRFNEIEIKNLESGRSLKRTASVPFSNQRMILAEFEIARELLNSMIVEVKSHLNPLREVTMVMHVVDEIPDGWADVEKRAYRDLAEQTGARTVLLSEYKGSLSDSIIMEGIKKSNWKF